MPFLKFKCKSCGKVFDELTKLEDISKLRCPHCGAEVERAYEGKCLGAKAGCGGGCGGSCASCGGGCGGH